MYCCLLLQIYLCYLWLLLCCRDTINITSYLYNYILNKNKTITDTQLQKVNTFLAVIIELRESEAQTDWKSSKHEHHE